MNNFKELCLKVDAKEHIDSFKIIHFAKNCRRLLYYGYIYDDTDFDAYFSQVKCLFSAITTNDADKEYFFKELFKIRLILESDIDAVIKGDPACESKQEIVLCYPGLEAISYYRIAHIIFNMGYHLKARIITEYAHRKCQIDIHPQATIGKAFCIDHGTGVVIGATAVIGNNVRIYQGVTLGAKWLNDITKVSGKRHPTIEDDVIIYANATILGGDTVIKKGAVIGASAFITKSL